jgi:glycerol-3-phosphate dehydrogenase
VSDAPAENGQPDAAAPVPAPRGDDRLNPEQRAQALAALRGTTPEHPLDVLVVGGGVVGTGCTLDAAARGLRTGLIEQRDLAAGTSSRSSRLAHGGLRYLEQLEFSLVHEALTERGLLLDRLAPHLVNPVPMIFPVIGKAWEKPYAGMGVTLYDMLSRVGAYGGSMPRPRLLSHAQIRGLAPSLACDDWQGAVQFYDAQIDDARHTVCVARTAVAHGAHVATGVRLESLLRDGDRVVGACAVPDDGEPFDIHARVVVAATGVWTDGFLGMCGQDTGPRVRQSKGVHLVVRRQAIRSTSAVIARTPNSVLFILPWGGRWLVGTTDTPYDGDLADPAVQAQDVDYLLEQANRWLVDPITREDIITTYCGLRPLVAADVAASQADGTTRLSREHVVFQPVPGAVVVTGGKYTTYRVMAEDAIDAAATDLALQALDGVEIPRSTTESIPLVGADGYEAAWGGRRRTARDAGLPDPVVVGLLRRHGDRIVDVLDLIAADPSLAEPLHPSARQLRAEAVIAVTHEGARDLDDILVRRLRIALDLPERGLEVLQDVVPLVAPHLGWHDDATPAHVQRYRDGAGQLRFWEETHDDHHDGS